MYRAQGRGLYTKTTLKTPATSTSLEATRKPRSSPALAAPESRTHSNRSRRCAESPSQYTFKTKATSQETIQIETMPGVTTITSLWSSSKLNGRIHLPVRRKRNMGVPTFLIRWITDRIWARLSRISHLYRVCMAATWMLMHRNLVICLCPLTRCKACQARHNIDRTVWRRSPLSI